MPPKPDDDNKKQQQQQCWECLRRLLACDGCRPVCDCCRFAGIVCPGYEDRRPLTWVTPGNVTITRIRRARKCVGALSATTAVPKKNRPQLPSPPADMGTVVPGPEAAAVITSVQNDKNTEHDADPDVIPDVIVLGDDSDMDGGGVEEGDDDGENSSNSDQTSASQDIITPQTRATSLALVSQSRRWSRSTQRRSISSIPPSLCLDELELMEAVEYCMLKSHTISYPDQDYPS